MNVPGNEIGGSNRIISVYDIIGYPFVEVSKDLDERASDTRGRDGIV